VTAVRLQIDGLYQLPLDEFTAARNALAKSLGGDQAKDVRALVKPSVVPWAVNQVYWRARATYDRLLKSGERLRAAQVAALEGRSADVREAGDAHRRAIADAVAQAERLASASNAKPAADALTRTFEALSLASSASATHGRLTEPLQPGGFEALAGIQLREAPAAKSRAAHAGPLTVVPRAKADGGRGAPTAAERAAAERARQHDVEVRKAEAALAAAETVEKVARAEWEGAHDAVLAARKQLLAARARKPDD
jgi:hypothetical protein